MVEEEGRVARRNEKAGTALDGSNGALTEGPAGALDPAHSSSPTQTASAAQTMALFGSSS